MGRDDKQCCALIGWIRFSTLIFFLLITQGGMAGVCVSVYICGTFCSMLKKVHKFLSSCQWEKIFAEWSLLHSTSTFLLLANAWNAAILFFFEKWAYFFALADEMISPHHIFSVSAVRLAHGCTQTHTVTNRLLIQTHIHTHTHSDYNSLWHSVVITVAHSAGRVLSGPRKKIGAVPKDITQSDRWCTYCEWCVCVCIHVFLSAEAGVSLLLCAWTCSRLEYDTPTITCGYLWINHAEQLIARDVLTGPNAVKSLPSWVKTLHIHPLLLSGCSPPAYNLPPGPIGKRRPRQAQDRGSSWATPLILPPSRSGPDAQGGNLYKHCTFDLCVQCLIHTLAH